MDRRSQRRPPYGVIVSPVFATIPRLSTPIMQVIVLLTARGALP